MIENEEDWDIEIVPTTGLFEIDWRELWQYRDLILLFVKRDLTATYKQTVLGPIWFFIQPIMTTLMYVIIFGNIAQISTDGMPKILFYLSGITVWNYFQECLMKTSETFIANQSLFGKVYFPRLAAPISIVISGLLKFSIQFGLFLIVWLYHLTQTESAIYPNRTILFLPFYILLMSGFGFSCGILISSLTTKYRDLRFLIQFGIQLLMYATPVVYPLALVPEKYRWLILLNPVASIIEAFRYSFTGKGNLSIDQLIYSVVTITIGLFFSVLIFNKIEKNFIDTV